MTATEAAMQNIARGTLLEVGDDRIVLGMAVTDYRLHLQVPRRINASLNAQIKGRITARAPSSRPIRRPTPSPSGAVDDAQWSAS